jgi:GT2 family glycosyltransferase/SAM-dependent methyltransferase
MSARGSVHPKRAASEPRGYVRDGVRRVWSRPGYRGIAYSDSDRKERELLESLVAAKDLGTLSTEFDGLMVDWMREAHLSPLRSNLLRPLDFGSCASVAELGAGCGALTRYLGELGLEVDAVEGNPLRAACAAERCRDLEGVRVFAEEISAFRPGRQYDLVTLVGVLEYSRLFVDSNDSVEACLRHAGDLLHPGGVLVLAIENQLGLKYFNGCAEDHLGTPFSGLTDLYTRRSAVTFGRRELEDRIRAAGFRSVDWYFPFPDYKIPTVVLSHRALEDPEFAAAELLFGDFARDYGGARLRSFDESAVWPVLERNGLLGDLANSFLVIASAGNSNPLDKGAWLAHRYSPARLPAYATDTVIRREKDDGLVVEKRALASFARAQEEQAATGELPLTQHLGRHPYVNGRLLARHFCDAVARGHGPVELAATLEPWMQLLGGGVAASGALATRRVTGDMVDCVPTNIIVDRHGRAHPIDLEFSVEGDIPLPWVVLRGLVHLSAKCFGHRIVAETSFSTFIQEMLAALGLGEVPDWEPFFQLEDRLVAKVLRTWPGRPERDILRSRLGLPISPVQSVMTALATERQQRESEKSRGLEVAAVAAGQSKDLSAWLATVSGDDGGEAASDEPSNEVVALCERIAASIARTGAGAHDPGSIRRQLEEISTLRTRWAKLAGDNSSLAARLNEALDEACTLREELSRREQQWRETAWAEANRLGAEAAERQTGLERALKKGGQVLRSIESRLHETQRQLAATREMLDKSRSAASRDLTESHAAARELAAVREQLLSAREELAAEKGRMGALAGERAALAGEVEVLREEASSLRKGLAQRRLDMVRLQRQLEHASVQVAQLEHEMARVASSATWVLAAPLRALHQRWPKPGEFARSAFKAAWWLMTGQLPERLSIRRRANRLEASGLFDHGYYLHRYADVRSSGEDPVKHYLRVGWREGRNPSPLFHESWYRERNADVIGRKESGLEHYIRTGEAEGRWPSPLFDPGWYRIVNEDVRNPGDSPLFHYLRRGAAEGRDPHPLFDTDWYVARHADVAALAKVGVVNPLAHFLETARVTGYSPCELFDSEWYLSHYPEVSASGENPLVHYLQHGAAMGLDPSASFQSSWYLDSNPDVALSRENPLVHFRLAGQWEGRAPRDPASVGTCAQAAAPVSLAAPVAEFIANGVDEWADYAALKSRIAEDASRARSAFQPVPPEMCTVDETGIEQALADLSVPASPDPVVSIVIPVFNNVRITVECMLSITRAGSELPFEIIVADDGSSDRTPELLPTVANLVYHRNEQNLGFLRNCNSVFPLARGRFVVLLNNDVQVTPGWLDSLIATFSEFPDAGAVGPKMIFPSGHLQEAGVSLMPDGSVDMVGLFDDPSLPRYSYPRPVDYCSGACLTARAEILRELGGFSEEFVPCYCEDSDLCLRIREKGFRIVYQPGATVIHHLSKTTAGEASDTKLRSISSSLDRFVQKWQAELDRISDVKVLAFYLPQFHPIPENDHWWGTGFTEWSNVTRARPNFIGHYQPHLPSDLGFYDLRVPEVMEAQAALARRYGIGGFCYYYYWFAGRRILEAPIERMLTTGRPDMPFCLCWANENWTRRWDGEDKEILIAQDHTPEDDEAVIRDLIRYFRSANYIRIDGRPLLLVYRVTLFPDFRATADRWRRVCRSEGVGEIYIAMVESFDLVHAGKHPSTFNCDAAVEFPPLGMAEPRPPSGPVTNPDFAGYVADYRDIAARFCARPFPAYTRFRGVMPGWDNTARRQNASYCFEHASPGAFQAWLETVIAQTRAQHHGDERIVFVNAWNEWAEGAHLEPDRRHGHAFLEAVRNAKDADRLLRINRYALDA